MLVLDSSIIVLMDSFLFQEDFSSHSNCPVTTICRRKTKLDKTTNVSVPLQNEQVASSWIPREMISRDQLTGARTLTQTSNQSVFACILYPPYWELRVWDVLRLHCVQATCRGFGMGRHCFGKKRENILKKEKGSCTICFFAVASRPIASDSQFFARKQLSIFKLQ